MTGPDRRLPADADRSPRRRRTSDTAQPDAGGHLLPTAPAEPELTAEHRLRMFFTSVAADQVTPVITEQEAEELASRLQHCAWVIERRMVGPWSPTSAPQRNRVVRDEVGADDLHPNAVPDDHGVDDQAGSDSGA